MKPYQKVLAGVAIVGGLSVSHCATYKKGQRDFGAGIARLVAKFDDRCPEDLDSDSVFADIVSERRALIEANGCIDNSTWICRENGAEIKTKIVCT
jgi:hypothetical protein